MLVNILLLLLGLAVLIGSGELLVKGAVAIAKHLHLSTLVIGMTVVSFGTSAPELIVSTKAALEGSPEIAIGNVVGSNIANIALVLAITVLIFPIIVDRNSKILDWPMMMIASILFYVFAYMDNSINYMEGIVLFVILIGFITYIIRKSRKENKALADTDYEEEKPKPIHVAAALIIAGLIGLYFGAEWLLEGSIGIAEEVGMPKHIVGLTIVAFGTSVPELATSAIAAFRHETDISIGNLIGSNIFNIMAVIGITAMVKETNVEQAVLDFDLIWMIMTALLLLPLMLIGKKLGRFQGILLLLSYVAYIVICIIKAKALS